MSGERRAIILAGGDGSRLRAWVRALLGEDRPKQFCRIVGDATLLEQTRRRVGRLIPAADTLTVVTRAHERFYAAECQGTGSAPLLVQPENRGTAPAILAAVLALAGAGRRGPVVIVPSDHHVSDDHAFMARVDAAFDAVAADPARVVLLGIMADRPETEYGWIEPGEVLLGSSPWPIYRVRRFWEKPAPPVAERLRRQGGLWNSFVMVAAPAALTRLVRLASPGLFAVLSALRPHLGTAGEAAALVAAYASLPSIDFSRHVLQVRPEDLAVLPVSGLEWNDLGDPERVMATRRRVAWEPTPHEPAAL